VLSQAELHQVARAYHLVAERICFLMDAIDEVFWQPIAGGGVRQVSASRFLLSVGQAKRDYATLFRAVENLPCRLDIRAGSQWLDESTRRFQALPINVEMRPRVSFTHLRELYEKANFVVIALLPEAHHSAGSVSIKEAMAMGKAVVVASSGGQADYVQHGRTGLLTPAGDSAALAQAIRLLLENPDMAAWMGRNARALLERDMRYDAKLDRLVQLAQVNSQADSHINVNNT
jgi:glycosyltransferase involved in cell wall biosynthesis